MKHETLTFRFLDMSRGGVARLFLLLLLPCLSVIGVKAADNDGGVKVTFNPGVRYSQWAINSRANDFYANTTKCGMATIKDGNVSNSSFGKDKLDYVPGLVAKSMIEAADYYQGFDWSNPWFLSVKEYGDKYYQNVPTGGGSLDDLNAVKLYIGLYNNTNATKTDKSNYKTAISRAQAGLVAHNKSNSIQAGTLAEKAGNNVLGGWFHKTAYNNQMWLDGAYMGSALLAQIVNFNGTGSNVFGSPTEDWDMVFKQLNIVWNMCWNPTDKLMYHAFEANAGTGTGTNESKSHADTWAGLNGTTESYTFHSAAYWGRANAWYLMALVDVLEAMKNAGQENTTNYTTLKQHLADLAAGIAARQDSKTGGWYQVMDDPSFKATSYNEKSSTATNYIETSATAIFAAAYFKAVRLGLLSTSPYDYKTIAKNAFEGLVNNYTYLDANGDMQIWGSCRSAGLGGDKDTALKGAERYRDGSKEYYLLGYDVPMVKQNEGITEGKVLGGFIMAATEYERAYQNQDSKQILFAKDLATHYDFTTTERELDATAYGNGDVSYQWYKSDGTKETKIADAISATYTPKENGNYYCEATANGKTIKTSETTVTAKSNSNTDNGSTDNNGGSENGSASDGTVTFSGDQLKSYSSPMTDASKIVTIATLTGTVQGESAGDIKVTKSAAFTISVAEGKYIKSITYKIKDSSKGELTFNPTDDQKVTSSDKLTYTYNYSDNKLSTVTATNSANKGGIQVTSIEVVYGTISSVQKYTVSATVKDGGSVSIKNGSSEVTSGTEVEANTSLTFTATPNDGYKFVNWTDASNKIVSANATYTTTVTAAISLTANFKAETPVDPTESGVKPVFLDSFKDITINLRQDSKNRTITVPLIHDGEDVSSYFKYTYTITPTGNTSNVTGSTLNFTPKTAGTYTVTVSATPDSDGTNDYSDVYDNPEPITFTLNVDSKYQTISVDSDPKNIQMYAGTTQVAPDLTVKNGNATLDDTEYNTLWFSTSPGVVKVDAKQER